MSVQDDAIDRRAVAIAAIGRALDAAQEIRRAAVCPFEPGVISDRELFSVWIGVAKFLIDSAVAIGEAKSPETD